MKRVLSALAVIPLMAACSGAPATTPTPSAAPVTAAASVSPTPTKAKPTFSDAELALIKAEGRTVNDSDIEQYLSAAKDVCKAVKPLSDEDAFTSLKQVDEAARRRAGRILIHLCGEPERFMPIVIATEVEGSMASGTYYVGDGDGEIKPGDYKTIGGVQDCYWVRKDKSGKIIANDLVGNAPGGVRLTVKKSDYEVTMERCGIWVPNNG